MYNAEKILNVVKSIRNGTGDVLKAFTTECTVSGLWRNDFTNSRPWNVFNFCKICQNLIGRLMSRDDSSTNEIPRLRNLNFWVIVDPTFLHLLNASLNYFFKVTFTQAISSPIVLAILSRFYVLVFNNSCLYCVFKLRLLLRFILLLTRAFLVAICIGDFKFCLHWRLKAYLS